MRPARQCQTLVGGRREGCGVELCGAAPFAQRGGVRAGIAPCVGGTPALALPSAAWAYAAAVAVSAGRTWCCPMQQQRLSSSTQGGLPIVYPAPPYPPCFDPSLAGVGILSMILLYELAFMSGQNTTVTAIMSG
jgi:hypothetical protein